MANFTILTEEEHDILVDKIIDAYYKGLPEEEIYKLEIQLPIQPYLAKSYKDLRGLDALLKTDFNLSDAIKEYGEEFVIR